MTILVQDTFTDADGTSLDAHTPNTASSGGWTEQTGNWQIATNQAVLSAGAALAHATIQSGVDDCTITAEVDNSATNVNVANDSGIVARWADSSNFWSITINAAADQLRIIERNATTNTSRANASVTITPGTLYTIQAVLNGQTITATLDGANEISYGSAALNETVTIHGIRARVTTDKLDDFLVETAGASPQTINASLHTNSSTVAQPALTFGAITVSASLHTNTSTVEQPAVTPGAIILSPTLHTNTSQLYAPTLTFGSIVVAPSLLTNTSTLFDPAVTVTGGGTQTIDALLHTNTSLLPEPTLTVGAITVSALLHTNTQTFFDAAVSVGAITVSLTLLTNTSEVYAPTLSAGGLVVEVQLVTNSSTLYDPALTMGSIAVSPTLHTNSSTLYAPQVLHVTEQTISALLLTNTSTLFDPVLLILVYVAERTYLVMPVPRLHTVAADTRTHSVPAEERIFVLA